MGLSQRLYESFLSTGYNPGSLRKTVKLQVILETPIIPEEGSILLQDVEKFVNNYANYSKFFLQDKDMIRSPGFKAIMLRMLCS